MKKFFLATACCAVTLSLFAQTYPEPEFVNELYLLKKDNNYSLTRLEKGSSKMETKTKLGGIGGSESGYNMDGEKSTVRLSPGTNLSFIISSGAKNSNPAGTAKSDSMMRANGIDPSMMKQFEEMNDPIKTITLYKVEPEKGLRKIFLSKAGGASPFSSHKIQSSDKYTFSSKKIRDGYWELLVDKALPKGEYAFTMMNYMGGAMGEVTLFAFGID